MELIIQRIIKIKYPHFIKYFFTMILLIVLIVPAKLYPYKIVGYKEKIMIKDLDMKYSALMDTGAGLCTLHAYGIRMKRRNNKLYVRFYTSNKKGQRLRIEKRVVNIVSIRSSNGLIERRFVIYLTISLAKISRKVQVTLTNRIRMSTRILIGRNFLKGLFLVDSSRKNIT